MRPFTAATISAAASTSHSAAPRNAAYAKPARVRRHRRPAHRQGNSSWRCRGPPPPTAGRWFQPEPRIAHSNMECEVVETALPKRAGLLQPPSTPTPHFGWRSAADLVSDSGQPNIVGDRPSPVPRPGQQPGRDRSSAASHFMLGSCHSISSAAETSPAGLRSIFIAWTCNAAPGPGRSEPGSRSSCHSASRSLRRPSRSSAAASWLRFFTSRAPASAWAWRYARRQIVEIVAERRSGTEAREAVSSSSRACCARRSVSCSYRRCCSATLGVALGIERGFDPAHHQRHDREYHDRTAERAALVGPTGKDAMQGGQPAPQGEQRQQRRQCDGSRHQPPAALLGEAGGSRGCDGRQGQDDQCRTASQPGRRPLNQASTNRPVSTSHSTTPMIAKTPAPCRGPPGRCRASPRDWRESRNRGGKAMANKAMAPYGTPPDKVLVFHQHTLATKARCWFSSTPNMNTCQVVETKRSSGPSRRHGRVVGTTGAVCRRDDADAGAPTSCW